MIKLTAIAVLAGAVLLSSGVVGATASNPSPAKVAQTAVCRSLTSFRESPIQVLPKPFETGCAVFTPLRANNPGTLVYVLKAGMKPPLATPSHGEITAQQAEMLNRLVDRGEALRITWFTPATIGSRQFVQSVLDEAVFVAWDDLCTKFQAQKVGCVELGAFRVRNLAEILVRNKERAATTKP